MAIKFQPQTQSAGFAMLLAIIVVGVVLTVGLSILDLSIKQVRLSTNSKQSEEAFHAANAGMECARYVRRVNADDMEAGQDIVPACFGVTAPTESPDVVPDSGPDPKTVGDVEAFQYDYEFEWGDTGSRCTRVSTVVIVADAAGSGGMVTDMRLLLQGYPTSAPDDVTCDAGSRCSLISVQGFNRPCSNTTGFGVVQREVLLQF